MKVAEVCRRDPIVIDRFRSIQQAAEIMRMQRVEHLVVVDDVSGKVPIGIVTDGDLVIEIMADKVNPEAVTVGDVMGLDLHTVSEDQEIESALRLMREKGVHHLPVVDLKGQLSGMLFARDLMDRLIDEKVL
ncbi:MAG: CBS domain-containing protein [Gammaproteobacteria bacterium]|nr:CBS domain-containing protein [Gammaproteobacteria bacterium]